MVIIHDHRIPVQYIEKLKSIFRKDIFYPLNMTGLSDVYESIRSHPDIYFFQVNPKTLVYAPCVPVDLLRLLSDSGVLLFEGRTVPSGKYPGTARYNAVKINKYLLCHQMHVDPVVLEVVELGEMECVSTKQGYARCSTLVVGDSGLITADRDIAAILAEKEELDVLRVPSSDIFLPGHGCGFWGGSSGNIPNGDVVLLGSVDKHTSENGIRGFFRRHKVKLIELDGLPLYDGGTIIFTG